MLIAAKSICMKSNVEKAVSTLQIKEDIPLHEKGWIVQRLGWILILGVMAAGLLGLFGQGLLSKQKVSSGNINAEYQRFFRYETEMQVALHSPQHISTILLPQQYLEKFSKIMFIPEPSSTMTISGGVLYNFPPSDNHSVSIFLTPQDWGSIDGALQVNNVSNIPLHHFIYP
jgi:hypothetical protein